MQCNSYGSYKTTIHEDMAAHDASPRWLRDVVNYSVASWASQPLLDEVLFLGDVSGRYRAWIIRNMQIVEQQDTLAHYGPSHPEAGGQP